MKKRSKALLVICIISIVFGTLSYTGIQMFQNYFAWWNVSMENQASHQPETLTMKKSIHDKNGNGIDDYTDILVGAKKEAELKRMYRSAYYTGGYPPENEGVCTDIIWRSLKYAGYDLKQLVDTDIINNKKSYPNVQRPDPNIDFRRVPNLFTWFTQNTLSYRTDFADMSEWNPGDIVFFSNDHVAVVSDLVNEKGIPFIIHSYGNDQDNFEENQLESIKQQKGISGHFRLP